MAINILIMGESGTGKSTAISPLDHEHTAIINVLGKALPFRNYKEKYRPLTAEVGNYYVSDNADLITRCINFLANKRPDIHNIVIDDFQYVMANEYMRRARETGYTKFTEIGQGSWNVLNAAMGAPDNIICYYMSHTDVNEKGTVKIKTIGKLLDSYCAEGMFTIVLHSMIVNGKYKFLTQHDGTHLAKSPIGLFDDLFIDNDLRYVQQQVEKYYEIKRID